MQAGSPCAFEARLTSKSLSILTTIYRAFIRTGIILDVLAFAIVRVVANPKIKN